MKLSKKLFDLHMDTFEGTVPELKALAAEAEALEARVEAYECLQKSSQAKIAELEVKVTERERMLDAAGLENQNMRHELWALKGEGR